LTPAKTAAAPAVSSAVFQSFWMQEGQKSRRWHYRQKPAHLAERRNSKRFNDIINIAYMSIRKAWIIAAGA
jgi:hypothetical protein